MNKLAFREKWKFRLFPHHHEEFTADLDLLIPDEDIGEIEVFVDDWILLWPTPAQMVAYGFPEKKALIDRKGILKKMKTAFKDWKQYTNSTATFNEKCDIVARATKEYINRFKKDGEWRFIKKAAYFITKDGDSELFSQILALKSKPVTITHVRTDSDHKFA